jgi:hypothetical protein
MTEDLPLVRINLTIITQKLHRFRIIFKPVIVLVTNFLEPKSDHKLDYVFFLNIINTMSKSYYYDPKFFYLFFKISN